MHARCIQDVLTSVSVEERESKGAVRLPVRKSEEEFPDYEDDEHVDRMLIPLKGQGGKQYGRGFKETFFPSGTARGSSSYRKGHTKMLL